MVWHVAAALPHPVRRSGDGAEQRWATRKLHSENRIADERAMFATAEGLSPRTRRKLFTPACTIHPSALVT
jgi:hypothetical protein